MCTNNQHVLYGDCFEVLLTLEELYGACIMDPPYSMPSLASCTTAGTSYGDRVFNPAIFFAKALEKIRPRLLEDAIVMQFCSWKTLPILDRAYFEAGLPIHSCIVWDKSESGPGPGKYVRPVYELVIVSFLGKKELHDRSVKDLFACKKIPSQRRVHPVEKPIGLLSWLLHIANTTSVLDPFAGSGSMGVACARDGVSYTGIECERRYVDIANKRIDAERRQVRL